MIIDSEIVLHLNENNFEYTVSGDVLTATYDGVTDVFDFTEMPDGIAIFSDIETNLAYNPVVKAERIDGVLIVTLIEFSTDW